MKPNLSRPKQRKGKRKLGQQSQPFDLAPYRGKMPIIIRVVDHALAFQGWPRSARIRMLRAIGSGKGTSPLSEILDNLSTGLTDGDDAPNSGDRHAGRCLGLGLRPLSAWTTGMRCAVDPVAK
jgi:hypothetical protein